MRRLDKKERLTGLERELVDLHSYFGYCMLNSIKVEVYAELYYIIMDFDR